MSDDFKPYACEIWELCPECGEQLDDGIEECVSFGCPLYLSVTNSLEAESVLSPMRDTREPIGSDEMFLPVKESA